MNYDDHILNRILYLLIIIIGTLTIFYQINFEDLWLDELNSFWVADPNLSYSETLTRHNKSDFHNPILFNLVLKYFFKTVGYNPDLARYLTLFFGSLSFIFIGLISYQEKKNNYFLLTTFLSCVSIYIIKYSQELRPYSLLLLTSSLNIFFYLRLFKEDKKIVDIILFIIFSVINYSVNPFSWTNSNDWFSPPSFHSSIITKADSYDFADRFSNSHSGANKSIQYSSTQKFLARVNSVTGLLEAKGPLVDRYKKIRYFNGDLHSYDVMLFWGCLRKNIKDRINAFI